MSKKAHGEGCGPSAGAKQWFDFVKSPKALQIFERYGFKPYIGGK
ncbi:MAG: hypothetical protein WC647_19505 [Desulfomonilaceae bacterium]|jgi:ABC-type molybdate transport system substrate-binding protein